MTLYTVHAPPPPRDAPVDPSSVVFVKEGFCWPALFIPELWMIYRRQWLVLILYLVAAVGYAFLTRTLADPLPVLGLVLLRFFFALEANGLRRWTLERNGYALVGVVEGRRIDEAEVRFFSAWPAADAPEPAEPAAPPPPAPWQPIRSEPAKPESWKPSAEAGEVVGLFPRARRRHVTVALIDYGAGNLRSAAKAFERMIAESGSRETVAVTSDPDVVARADRVVLPGDGAFADCRRNLDAVPGMVEALDEALDRRGRPFFGICVGMQLLATRGVEHGITAGLDRIGGEVRAVEPTDPGLKVPHMGWNTLVVRNSHPLLADARLGPEGLHAYFLHSFHLVADDDADVIATAEYGGQVTAIVARGNIAGTQFHPEKSQHLGLSLIGNFLKWTP